MKTEKCMWTARENEMLRNWLNREKQECEELGQHDYSVTNDGIVWEESHATWISKLYESLSSEVKAFDYLYTYSFQDDEKVNYYFVDVGYRDIDCRINLFYEQNGYTKIQFKERQEFDYWEYESYRLKKVRDAKTLKEVLKIILPFYEKVKKAVQKQTPNRLRFIVNDYKMNEYYIKKLKKEMNSL